MIIPYGILCFSPINEFIPPSLLVLILVSTSDCLFSQFMLHCGDNVSSGCVKYLHSVCWSLQLHVLLKINWLLLTIRPKDYITEQDFVLSGNFRINTGFSVVHFLSGYITMVPHAAPEMVMF